MSVIISGGARPKKVHWTVYAGLGVTIIFGVLGLFYKKASTDSAKNPNDVISATNIIHSPLMQNVTMSATGITGSTVVLGQGNIVGNTTINYADTNKPTFEVYLNNSQINYSDRIKIPTNREIKITARNIGQQAALNTVIMVIAPLEEVNVTPQDGFVFIREHPTVTENGKLKTIFGVNNWGARTLAGLTSGASMSATLVISSNMTIPSFTPRQMESFGFIIGQSNPRDQAIAVLPIAIHVFADNSYRQNFTVMIYP